MNKAFERILERLEELQNNLLSQTEGDINLQVGVINGVMYSKKIVHEVAEEYTSTEHINCSTDTPTDTSTNGWIPCSERLPKESGEYLTWVEYDGNRFCAIDEINCDGIIKEWNCSTDYKIIAWQPLPEPYTTKGE